MSVHMKTRLNIAVVMGGPSAEHDISLNSGRGVAAALRRRGWGVEEIIVPQAISIDEAGCHLRAALQPQAVEAVFLALHGAFGEDGTVQELCESLGLAYTGSDPAASRLGMDKVASRRRFEAAGLAVPRWRLLDAAGPPAWQAAQEGPYPCVIKPVNQGSSVGVSLVRDARGLASAVSAAGRYSPQVLMEAYIRGRELTVGVLDGRPLPVVEIRPTQPFFDFTAKYTAGMTDYLVPAPLPAAVSAKVQAAGVTAHEALGCRHLSRADILLDAEGEPVVLEVNTIPGFTPTSLLPKAAACAGLSYDALCEQLVQMACRDRQPASTFVSERSAE